MYTVLCEVLLAWRLRSTLMSWYITITVPFHSVLHAYYYTPGC